MAIKTAFMTIRTRVQVLFLIIRTGLGFSLMSGQSPYRYLVLAPCLGFVRVGFSEKSIILRSLFPCSRSMSK